MQSDNRLLDDLARVANGALGGLQGFKDEMTARLRDQFERVLADMDMVPREEFDAVKAMAAEARAQNEALAARLAALEAKLGVPKPERATAKTAKAKRKTAKAAAGKDKGRKAPAKGRGAKK
jgi:BMFP domain-containing protein YqiC